MRLKTSATLIAAAVLSTTSAVGQTKERIVNIYNWSDYVADRKSVV
jgi:spermidine/putrescine-binding protein